jgi:hypothetical protein
MLSRVLTAHWLLITAVSIIPATATASERCHIPEHTIVVIGGSEVDRALICEGAQQALQVLMRCAIAPKTTISIKVQNEVRHPLAGAIFGYYDLEAQYIALTNLSSTTSLMQGTPYEGISQAAFLQSLAVHEVVHSVMHQNLRHRVYNPAVYEFPAYALQIASLPVEARTLFLKAFDGERIKKAPPFSDTILSFAPYFFAARAYEHFVSFSDGCALLRQVMKGGIDVAAEIGHTSDPDRP